MTLSITIFLPCEPTSYSTIWFECLIEVDEEADEHFIALFQVIVMEEIIWEHSEGVDENQEQNECQIERFSRNRYTFYDILEGWVTDKNLR